MIDVHCHLEQKDYDKDRGEVIEKCKKELKAVITSCAHPRDVDLTSKLAERYKNFVFASYGIHPEYIKEVSEKEIKEFLELLSKNKERFVAIGETGLDRFWIKEPEWQEKQKELFIRFVSIAKQMSKPLIIHSREASEDTVKILEQENAKKVLLHLWGDKNSVNKIIENDWYVSVGPILLRSKNHKKLIRDLPLERIMTETDSPWFGIEEKRGIPTNVKSVVEKIAEVKKMNMEEVDRITTENAIKFFSLNL
jgi:TatD DNase family protein